MTTTIRMIMFTSFAQAIDILREEFDFDMVLPEDISQAGMHVVGIAADFPFDEDALIPSQCAFVVLVGEFSKKLDIQEIETVSDDPISGKIITATFNQNEIPLIADGKIVDDFPDRLIGHSLFEMSRCNCIWKS